MKLSASNIAWTEADDEVVLSKLIASGLVGIEIAPTRLVPFEPYKNKEIAVNKAEYIKEQWDLDICSMQSLWFGIENQIFASKDDRDFLYGYTCSAIDFAVGINCKHLVFGNPRNRVMGNKRHNDIALEFFNKCADYAFSQGVVIGIEANPSVYGTDFLNTTYEAIDFVKCVDSSGFKLNLDIGTMILNGEDVNMLERHFELIKHIHISEPYLAPINIRKEHQLIKAMLRYFDYKGYVSIEMKNSGIDTLFKSIEYVSDVFLDA
ncbi:TPA: sugar phosphate isomerase/epimerase [Vibrio cholerae]|nr:sugar phosphate isomerase/epimerase [Vibrio cholerae]